MEVVRHLQRLPGERFWVASTKLGDPAWTFLVYFPLIFPIAPDVSLRFLVAGAISEFINGILKWFDFDKTDWWCGELNFQFLGFCTESALTGMLMNMA